MYATQPKSAMIYANDTIPSIQMLPFWSTSLSHNSFFTAEIFGVPVTVNIERRHSYICSFAAEISLIPMFHAQIISAYWSTYCLLYSFISMF